MRITAELELKVIVDVPEGLCTSAQEAIIEDLECQMSSDVEGVDIVSVEIKDYEIQEPE